MRIERIDPWRLRIAKEGAMRVPATLYASEALALEERALGQLADAAALPGATRVLATPDIHVGFGVPIGCVAALRDHIVPAAVGYDINCGMRLLSTPLAEGELGDLAALARDLRREVPLGEGQSNVALDDADLDRVLAAGLAGLAEVRAPKGRWADVRDAGAIREDARAVEENGRLAGDPGALSPRARSRGAPQLGTLGGGNHFIEIQVVDRVEDEATARAWGLSAGGVVVMVHSGSRGLGHQVGGDYMKLAAKKCGAAAKSRELAWLEVDGKDGRAYVGAMRAAANWAYANRQVMADLVRSVFRRRFGEIEMPTVYDVPHNMAKPEEHDRARFWVHRKGATRAFPASRMAGTPYARTGQPVLIPGSMGTASYLLVGVDSGAESLYSVNHGAGRTMSRTEAAGRRGRAGKRGRAARITDDAFREAMKGVVLLARDRRGAKEEAPQAYKDIDEVVRVVAGAGLARVVARMIPRAVLKG